MSRFNHIKYDAKAQNQNEVFKSMFQSIESLIGTLESHVPKNEALIKLEECFMWIGKAIRNDQTRRSEDCLDKAIVMGNCDEARKDYEPKERR